MSELQLDVDTERVATNLLRFLEWGDEGFSLIFLFADVGPAQALADWLDERFSLTGSLLQRVAAATDFSADPEGFVDAVMGRVEAWNGQFGGVWLELHRHPGDEPSNDARMRFLARLNERRYLLERDLKHPLVLVLPVDFRPEARTIAPDLWHVRGLSEELRSPVQRREGQSITAVETDRAFALPSLGAYVEWQRLQTGTGSGRAFLPTAWRAVEELIAAERQGEAAQVAARAVEIARDRVAEEPTLATWSDLGISLDGVAKVAATRGDLSLAESKCRESLEIARRLMKESGGTPQASIDVSISLGNLARVRLLQGAWDEAEAAWRASADVRRHLVERLGETPETVRPLAGDLELVGMAASQRLDWKSAADAYREVLELTRRLIELGSATPESQRGLSTALDNVGRTALELGDLRRAEVTYRESFELRRGLLVHVGDTQALRDLTASLDNIGLVAAAQGDLSQAEAAQRASLELRRQLVQRANDAPLALRDLAVALNNAGRTAAAREAWDEAASLFRESLAISRRLVGSLGSNLQSLEDLAIALLRVASVPPGDPVLEAEAIDIYAGLAQRHPQVARFAQHLAALRGDNSPPPSTDRSASST